MPVPERNQAPMLRWMREIANGPPIDIPKDDTPAKAKLRAIFKDNPEKFMSMLAVQEREYEAAKRKRLDANNARKAALNSRRAADAKDDPAPADLPEPDRGAARTRELIDGFLESWPAEKARLYVARPVEQPPY